MAIADRMLPSRPITKAATAISRIGTKRLSGDELSRANLLATTDRMIISSGTPVDSTQARTNRSTTPGRRKFSGTPPRSAATATGRSTRSDCR